MTLNKLGVFFRTNKSFCILIDASCSYYDEAKIFDALMYLHINLQEAIVKMDSQELISQNNNPKLIPLWLQEIVDNGDRTSAFKIFDDDCLYASIMADSKIIHRCYSLSIPNETYHQKQRVAFFRDGPFLESTNGGTTGAVTSILGMMEVLVDNGFDVFLFYCFRGWSNPKLYIGKKFSTIFIRPEDFYENELVISNLVNYYDISICHFDSAEAINWQSRFVNHRAKIVFEVHNVVSTLMQQNGAPKEMIANTKALEKNAISMADVVLLRSRKDLLEMQKINPNHSNMKIYRGCISLDTVKPKFRRKQTGDVVFLGHLNYEPNIQALELIANRIAPYIEGRCYIVGSGSNSLLEKYSDEKLIFLNWVENISEIFSNVDIALAPITSGSGTSLKVLDYMANHVPVIATSLAVRGLGEDIEKAMIIEDDIDNYPNIIRELLKQPELMEKYAKLGCSYVRKNFDWKVGISDVIQAYSTVLNDDMNICVSFEGMPRAGKTTITNMVKNEFENVIECLDEIFFTPDYYNTMEDHKGVEADSIWFLDQEAERLQTQSKKPIFLTDRCYLSTLAYSYARSKFTKRPEDFKRVSEHFFMNLANYPNYKVIFVFDIDPCTTFERRANKDAPDNALWMNEVFMNYYREFYQRELHKYTSAKLIHLNKDGTLEQNCRIVYQALTNLIQPLISVVLCSHNDKHDLEATLRSLDLQTLGTENFEVIIVDNASVPALKSFVDAFSSSSPLIIRYFYENRLGLSVARNSGVNLAKSNIIAITDPENIANTDWLSQLYETFKNSPDTVLVGGKILNAVNGTVPWYFSDNLLEYFTPMLWPKELSPIDFPYFITGANMAFRKTSFNQINGFNEQLGRIGKRLLSCEDLHFTIKLQEKYGHDKCLIQPKATISHVSSNTVFGFRKLLLRGFWQGVSESRMLETIDTKNVYNKRSISELLKNFCAAALSLTKFNMANCVLYIFLATVNLGYLYENLTKKTKQNLPLNECDEDICRFG